MKNQPVLIKTHHAEKKHNRESRREQRQKTRNESIHKHTNRETFFDQKWSKAFFGGEQRERDFKVFPSEEKARARREFVRKK